MPNSNCSRKKSKTPQFLVNDILTMGCPNFSSPSKPSVKSSWLITSTKCLDSVTPQNTSLTPARSSQSSPTRIHDNSCISIKFLAESSWSKRKDGTKSKRYFPSPQERWYEAINENDGKKDSFDPGFRSRKSRESSANCEFQEDSFSSLPYGLFTFFLTSRDYIRYQQISRKLI